MTTFYVGTHQPGWLADPDATRELFISDRRIHGYKTLPHANAPWALDSGGFSELQQYGSWGHGPSPAEYVARIRRYRDEVGHLAWAAPQDWMCEPVVIDGGTVGPIVFAGTHLSIAEHQRRTVDNYLQLRTLAPELPIIPVLQGWERDDYLRCADLYAAAGVDLPAEPLVGLGSVCRRQATSEAEQIVTAIQDAGIPRLHGFGFKTLGLRTYGWRLTSADSLAWSLAARRQPPLPGCVDVHKNCANCRRWAYAWRDRVVAQIALPPAFTQPAIPFGVAA